MPSKVPSGAGKLYDKLRLFVTDMEAVGASLDKANQSYQGAMNKLATGRGNVIRQAESFKLLGVEVKRDISPALAEQAQAATAITEESKPSALSPAVSAANDLP